MEVIIQSPEWRCEAIMFTLPGEETGPETFRAKSESHVSQSPVPSLLKVLGRHVQLSGAGGGGPGRLRAPAQHGWGAAAAPSTARGPALLCRVVLCPMSLGGQKRLLAQPL